MRCKFTLARAAFTSGMRFKSPLFFLMIILSGLFAGAPFSAAPRAGIASVSAVGSTYYFPAVFTPPLQPPYNMVDFLSGDGRLYEVQHSSGSQARHQTQLEGGSIFHTKGHEVKAEWEELWITADYVYRGTDTSPGKEMYYTLRDSGMYGSRWAPRVWNVGDLFERDPYVAFYYKDSCAPVPHAHGTHKSYLLFEAFYPEFTFDSGLKLYNVIQLAWLLTPNGQPEERYYYAERYGLVGWWSRTNGMSYISEIHQPGARPDNKREAIPCLDRSPMAFDHQNIAPLPFWPGEHRR